MIRVKLCFAAEGIVQDARSNLVSAFNVLEAIRPLGLPFIMNRLAYYALWERDEQDEQRVDGRFLLRVDNDELSSIPVSLEFQGGRSARNIVYVGGLVLQRPGVLLFTIAYPNDARADYSVEIAAPPAAAGEQPPAAAGAPPVEGIQG